MIGKRIVLVAPKDEGIPQPEDFCIEEYAFDLEAEKSALPENGLIVQLLAISPDPYLRNTMKTGGSNPAGQAFRGFVSGKIIGSKHPNWTEGDLFGANLPFATLQSVPPAIQATTKFHKLSGVIDESQISLGVGVLGMPGSTAYGGLTGILQPKEGETIFISAASGAVGSMVGMIAKEVFKCKVIGSCGGEEKGQLIKSKFHFDHAIDYKKANTKDDLVRMLKEVAPEGIDMYFENVGGIHWEAALEVLKVKGRVCVCGAIQEYNLKERNGMTFSPLNIIYKQQKIEGLLCFEYLSGVKGNFVEDMTRWYKEGKVTTEETFFDGIENWAQAFQALFLGLNKGKVVLRV